MAGTVTLFLLWRADTLNLRPGDLRAAAGPSLRGRSLHWPVAGPTIIVLTLLLFAVNPPAHALGHLTRALAWLPVIALGALVNAAAEEFLYRHAAVRALRDTMGGTPAVLLTSALFGLGHLTGNLGGVIGVLYTTVFGLACAHAMVRTRGFGWNLPIHFFGDIGVAVTLTLTAAAH